MRTKFVRFLNAQIAKPLHRFSAKDLSSWPEFSALMTGAKTQTDDSRVVAGAPTIDLRATVPTKHHDSWLATATGFGIGPRWSPVEVKFVNGDVHSGSKRRTRQDLATVAMADADLFGIYLSLIGEFTAVAASVNLHSFFNPFVFVKTPNSGGGDPVVVRLSPVHDSP
jgi:hypothetical protein